MALLKKQKRSGVPVSSTHLLPLLALGFSLLCCTAAATVDLQTHTTVKEPEVRGLSSDAAGGAPLGGLQDPSVPVAVMGSPKEGVGVANIAADRENLARLLNAIVAAEEAETEKLTDSGFFLGVVSQKTKRHLFVDVLGLLALVAGYYLIAAGLEQKAAQKSA